MQNSIPLSSHTNFNSQEKRGTVGECESESEKGKVIASNEVKSKGVSRVDVALQLIPFNSRPDLI